jgi:hypothetical protein
MGWATEVLLGEGIAEVEEVGLPLGPMVGLVWPAREACDDVQAANATAARITAAALRNLTRTIVEC